jgi:hypothetical protein
MRLYALLLVCEVVAMELILFLASALFLHPGYHSGWLNSGEFKQEN